MRTLLIAGLLLIPAAAAQAQVTRTAGPSVDSPAAADSAPDAPDEPDGDGTPAVRFALGLSGGAMLDIGDGGIGGLSLQLGARLHRHFALYYQVHGLAGVFITDDSGRALFTGWNAIMAELILGPIQLSAGPSLDYTTGCAVMATTNPETTNPEPTRTCGEGLAPGIGTRAALVVSAFSLSGDVHVSFPDDVAPTVTLLVGIGMQLG